MLSMNIIDDDGLMFVCVEGEKVSRSVFHFRVSSNKRPIFKVGLSSYICILQEFLGAQLSSYLLYFICIESTIVAL